MNHVVVPLVEAKRHHLAAALNRQPVLLPLLFHPFLLPFTGIYSLLKKRRETVTGSLFCDAPSFVEFFTFQRSARVQKRPIDRRYRISLSTSSSSARV